MRKPSGKAPPNDGKRGRRKGRVALTPLWSKNLEKLRRYKERFGHCNVPVACKDAALANWVHKQRRHRNEGVLSRERIQRLDELGFDWNRRSEDSQKVWKTWMKWYRELKNFTREHGTTRVQRHHANTKLTNWVWIQRGRRGKNAGTHRPLTDEQIALLDKLGFTWDLSEELWAKRLERLTRFKAQHGHCDVGFADGDDDLLAWVKRARMLQRQGLLAVERKAQLDAIGFSWTPTTYRRWWWGVMYERLKQYHAKHGNTDVPHASKEEPSLAGWVSTQRRRRKEGRLSAEKVRLLNLLGLTWQCRERGTWEDRFAEVVAFKEKNGHCDIPVYYLKNPRLGYFVNSMRTQRKRGELSADRIARLDGVGFSWVLIRRSPSRRPLKLRVEDRIRAEWVVRFNELLRYQQKHGDCNVPRQWPNNPALGNWVYYQRQLRKNGTLQPKRQRWLDEIGFEWRPEKRK